MIDSYNTLPIGKYLEICDIVEQELSELDRQAEILAVLDDSTPEEILDRPILEYKELAAKSRFLEHDIPDVTNRIAKVYKIGKWELIPTTDIRKMSTAQYVDFQAFTKDGQKKLVEVLSCFLVPKGYKYNTGYDVLEVQDAIRDNLSVVDVSCLSAFFFKKFRESIKAMLIYSKWMTLGLKNKKRKQEMWRRIQEQLEILEKGGGGLRQ